MSKPRHANPDDAGPQRRPPQDWQPWTMREFPLRDTPEPDHRAETGQGQDSLRVQLDELAKQARSAARRQGQEEGRAEGYAQGLEQGKANGFSTGKQQGQAEGYQQGYADGQAASAAETERLAQTAGACAQALLNLEADVGQALIRLAVSIAQQVVRSTLAADSEKILETVHDILQATDGNQALLRLRVNSADAELVRRHLTNDPTIQNWRLIADDGIEQGGCMAETALGNIDATLQTRWQRVISTLGVDRPWSTAP